MVGKKKAVSFIMLVAVMFGVNSQYAEAEEHIEEVNVDENMLQPSEVPRKKNSKKSSTAVNSRTFVPKEELENIQQLQKNYRLVFDNLPMGEKYSTKPVLSNGVYQLGVLKEDQRTSIEKQINFYRTLAGVKAIPYTNEADDIAQHGAMGMAAIGQQTHFIEKFEKPEDMSEEFWKKACVATNSSNIHSSIEEQTFDHHANAFMIDYGDTNKSVGHRSGILSLTADSLGVGYAKTPKETEYQYYTTLYKKTTYKAFSEYDEEKIVQWPTAENFPYEAYNKDNPYAGTYYKDHKDPSERAKYEKNMRWSVFLHQNGYYLPESEIRVFLIDNESGIETEMKTDNNDGELTVEDISRPSVSSGFDTISFRPNNDYVVKKDTLYTVKILGIQKEGKTIDYQYNTRLVGMYDHYEADKEQVTEITVTPKKNKLAIGEKKVLSSVISPKEAEGSTLDWQSENPQIATVDSSGKVTAVGAGKVTITASAQNGKVANSAEIEVVAGPILVESLFPVYEHYYNINVNEEFKLYAFVFPENATNKEYTFFGMPKDEAFITIDNQKKTFKASKRGQYWVWMKSADGNFNTGDSIVCYLIDVGPGFGGSTSGYQHRIPVESVTLDKKKIEVAVGEKFTLTHAITPANAASKYVSYLSSDKDIVQDRKELKQSSATFEAKSKGKTTITVVSHNGKKTDICEVTVR
ncbi:hypothetical protein DOK67_0001214 [Enterococcus sp. DIV0212c]|uniref:Ig-like domain-containing protein n=1 Tax=Enterococcus sp. DIV0212c TaxID=2230867 RepID=UPI001A9AA931|nr:Ig-like domain-containing protein [Enterococcus sp. DIV0212c]MBO1353663.1 Ig-like domain-containing protein [Enterococcus sp. DIV0212c]